MLLSTPLIGLIIYKVKRVCRITSQKVKVQDENERGRLTTTNEVYCVEAESCTEAEAKVVKEFENVQVEYQVKEVKETKIIKILE